MAVGRGDKSLSTDILYLSLSLITHPNLLYNNSLFLGSEIIEARTRTIPNLNNGSYKSCEGGSLVEVPASSKAVYIASHTPPAPHYDITSPANPSTSITTQLCGARARGRCGCATVATPGGPSLGCAVVGYHYFYRCSCCVFFAFVAIHIRALAFGCVCRHTPAFILLIMYVSRVFRYTVVRSRVLAADGNYVMKGCRTAARVKFCEGARTCVRTRWYYSNASRRLPTQVRTPGLGHNIPIYEEGALIAVLCEDVAKHFRQKLPRIFAVGRHGS